MCRAGPGGGVLGRWSDRARRAWGGGGRERHPPHSLGGWVLPRSLALPSLGVGGAAVSSCQSPEPVSVALFGKKVSADVVKLWTSQLKSCWIMWVSPNPMTSVLIRNRRGESSEEMKPCEDWVGADREGGRQPRAPGRPVATRTRRGGNSHSPGAPGGIAALDTPISD